MASERWRTVVGYDGLYKVSDRGRVKSERINTRISDKETRIMKEKIDNHGYARVNLYDQEGRCSAKLVSRLVADAFIPNPKNLPHVGHNNDKKLDNTVDNLYWTDPYENNRHNGKLEQFQKAHNQKIELIAEKLSQKVRATAIDGSESVEFKSIQEASRCGFDCGKISLCINGKRNHHKGYTWERIE